MNIQKHLAVARIFLPLLMVILACSQTPTFPFSSTPTEPGYRFDELPVESNESAAFEQYKTISKWATESIAYFFVNGTEQLAGDTERDIIRQAFAL